MTTLDGQVERITEGMRGIAGAMTELGLRAKEAVGSLTEVARHLRDADAEGDPDEPMWEDAHRWSPSGEHWRP